VPVRLDPVFDGERPPGVYRWVSRSHPATVVRDARRRGWWCAVLDGHQIPGRDAFFGACAERLRFPAFFVPTWSGLRDCVADLSWLPAADGRLLLYDDCDLFARNEPGEWAEAVQALRTATTAAPPDGRGMYVLLRGGPLNGVPTL